MKNLGIFTLLRFYTLTLFVDYAMLNLRTLHIVLLEAPC